MVKLTDEIQELMLSSAYKNSSNPKHKEVVKRYYGETSTIKR